MLKRIYFKKEISIIKGDSTSSQQSLYVLQSINTTEIDNSRKRMRSDSNPTQEVKDKGEGRKQMLTLKEDGSLEMIEIMKDIKVPNIDSTFK